MALNIKSEEADRLARELAKRTGESLTQAVVNALRDRLERYRQKPDDDDIVDEVLALSDRFLRLPVLEARSLEEIIGYDEHGAPRWRGLNRGHRLLRANRDFAQRS